MTTYSIRCSQCNTMLDFESEPRYEGCKMFEKCSNMSILALLLDGTVKRCSCGRDVKLKVSHVIMAVGEIV